MLKMFARFPGWVEKLSRRQDHLMRKWAAIAGDRQGMPLPRKAIRDHGEKYEAINITHNRTVEFRIFRGTLSRKPILRNLQFVALYVRFCKRAGIQELTPDRFSAFCRKEGYKDVAEWSDKCLESAGEAYRCKNPVPLKAMA